MKKRINLILFSELALVFLFGAVFYYGIEVLWRGYSHFSMSLLGGLCFLSLYLMGKALPDMPLLLYCILGGLIISTLEFFAGEILNNCMKLEIWDYSSLPLNFRGQICALFSLFWCLLCMPANWVSKLMRCKIFGCEK